jgi:hypothetical protein
MRRIVLISCVSKKRTYKTEARNLYISPLFKKNLQYALKLHPDQIFILSAKYGLVPLDEEIEPYDLTLNTMSAKEIKDWSAGVLRDLAGRFDLQQDQFIFLAGLKYRKYIIEHLAHVEIPFEGLTIGRQLQRLTEEGDSSND